MGCEGRADQPWRTYVLSHGWDQSLSTAVDHNDRGPVGLCYVSAFIRSGQGLAHASHRSRKSESRVIAKATAPLQDLRDAVDDVLAAATLREATE